MPKVREVSSSSKASSSKQASSSKASSSKASSSKQAQLEQMREAGEAAEDEDDEPASGLVRRLQSNVHVPPVKSLKTATEAALAAFTEVLAGGNAEEARAFLNAGETSTAIQRGAAAAPGRIGQVWQGTIVQGSRPDLHEANQPVYQAAAAPTTTTTTIAVIAEEAVPSTPKNEKPKAKNPLTPTTAMSPPSSFDGV